ncbi:hypothetical protein H8356DRAFT_1697044 [Neocallimastix lanati (nom. inval.)]|uniref:VanZ-like domain-containing protein n=1 Tax=Neocallimastix californiae TaxID=1754190 RepID=A0A1Y2BZH3_9FUNG|nr:hypothetical protein H8356DRAFT_1697044 [Neocallimastix sp. JGI-2020a]ORY40064.1 hypothetical protein LY90DRAFT_672296 [Neocallimastix californiae]|eukprot:ORY40064.1 hypothetical protein LY90DRAFT_672296 [Neocallimastix californiae]
MKIRYSVAILTGIFLLYCAYLGFAPRDWVKLPKFIDGHDQILHCIIFFIVTTLLNFILIIQRSFLYWAGVFIGMIAWSVISEGIQSLFPYKIFDVGDIIGNLIGTTLSSVLILSIRCIKYRMKNKISQEPQTIPLV